MMNVIDNSVPWKLKKCVLEEWQGCGEEKTKNKIKT